MTVTSGLTLGALFDLAVNRHADRVAVPRPRLGDLSELRAFEVFADGVVPTPAASASTAAHTTGSASALAATCRLAAAAARPTGGARGAFVASTASATSRTRTSHRG